MKTRILVASVAFCAASIVNAGQIGGTGTWTEVTGLPQAWQSMGMGELNGLLYSVGGNSGNGASTNVFTFDGNQWGTSIGLPVARHGLSVESLNGALYAVGGDDGWGNYYTNVYKFDGVEWTEMAGLVAGCYSPSVGRLGDALYAVGGYDGVSGPITNVFRFDGTQWTEVAGLPAPRLGSGVGTLGGALYVVGGWDNFARTNVFRYDGANWTEVAGLPAALQGLVSGVMDGMIYAFDSRDPRPGYKFDGISWAPVAGMLQERGNIGAGVLNGALYAAGGFIPPPPGVQTNVYRYDPDTGVKPSSGSWTGGYSVVISGTNLGNGADITNVTLCGVQATVVGQSGSTQVVVTAGVAGSAGMGDVRVFSTSYGETVKSNGFTYLKAVAAVALNNLSQTYTGTARPVSATTVPAGLAVTFLYDGSASPPVNAGSYAVTGTVVDAMYQGGATGVLVVGKATQTITFPAIGRQYVVSRVGLAASASSGLPVTFNVGVGPAVISGGINLAFTGTGVVSVVARQTGDANWRAAPRVTNIFLVALGQLLTDYDGDGRSDLAVYDNARGLWSIRTVAGAVLATNAPWGYAQAQPVGGDYDGDGASDMAVYDDRTGAWYIRRLNGSVIAWNWRWGYTNAVPVPGDYDGDGRFDPAVFEPDSGKWYIIALDGRLLAWGLKWGYPGTESVSGDYNGDGRSDLATYDPATGQWFIRTLAGQTLAWRLAWGYADAISVPGDYNGDGCADLAVYDVRTANWYIRSLTGATIAWGEYWGFSGGYPVPGDYDGDGRYDLSIYSVNDVAIRYRWVGNWYIRKMPEVQAILWAAPWGTDQTEPVEGRPKWMY